MTPGKISSACKDIDGIPESAFLSVRTNMCPFLLKMRRERYNR